MMQFNPTADMYYFSPVKMTFWKLVFGDPPAFLRTASWNTETTNFELDHVIERRQEVNSSDVEKANECVGWLEGSLVYYRFGGASVVVEVTGRTEAEVTESITTLRKAFPVPQVEEKQQVPITFWHYGNPNAGSRRRLLDVPRWDEVINNYAAQTTRPQLGDLMAATQPVGGKLLLWSGNPGTGKTYAIRALAWEWRKWVDVHYLIDPERFFGDHQGALMNMLNEYDNDKWKLLVLEDTGEMLTADAKSRVGQGLSRLLNIVDGLLGQSLKVLILITTNEELGTLHPAVTRPGRCWQHVEFDPLTKEEANEWLDRHDQEGDCHNSQFLADLYSRINEWGRRVEKRKPVGFVLPSLVAESPLFKES